MGTFLQLVFFEERKDSKIPYERVYVCAQAKYTEAILCWGHRNDFLVRSYSNQVQITKMIIASFQL